MNRISTHFLDLEGIKTAYYSTEGEGTPIVLLHGGGVDHAMLSWKTIMQTWTGSQPLVALDLRGTATAITRIRVLAEFLHGLPQCLP